MILNIWPITIVPFVAAILVTIHSIYIVELSDYIKKGFKNGRKVVALKKRLKMRTKKYRPVERRYFKRMKLFWLIFLSVFLFIIAMYLFESKGIKSAKKLIENLENNTYDTIKTKVHGSEINLAYLYCGSRNCAGLSLKTAEIVYFPQNGHSFLQSTKSKNKLGLYN